MSPLQAEYLGARLEGVAKGAADERKRCVSVLEELVQRAEVALLEAKQSPTWGEAYSDEIRLCMAKRDALMQALTALEKE